jgi:hypothetical protein
MTLPVLDVICLSVPEEIDPVAYRAHPDRQVWEMFIRKLSDLAMTTVWAQWPDHPPVDVKFKSMTWLITNLVADVEDFQPDHDCPDCWAGNRKAELFLLSHPGRYVAMANISYVPIWKA